MKVYKAMVDFEECSMCMILNLAGNKAINILMREGVGHTAVSAPVSRNRGTRDRCN